MSKNKIVLQIFFFTILLFSSNKSWGNRYIVLFVHGLASEADTWQDLFNNAFGISEDDFDRHTISCYPSPSSDRGVIHFNPSIVESKYYAMNLWETPNGNNGAFDNLSFETQGKLVTAIA
ncbi:MAG: hypothetical protein C4527_16100 [Candidatus Omnitrophota bacterium]|jgi:hypothetical protein|nr:MAG: hypothetical protein C4527_16100 [Candidatus Omnitrophota bacterium]